MVGAISSAASAAALPPAVASGAAGEASSVVASSAAASSAVASGAAASGAVAPGLPAVALVELADQDEQLVGGRLDAGGQVGYPVAERLDVGRGLVGSRGLHGRDIGLGRRSGRRGRRDAGNGRNGNGAGLDRHDSIITPSFSTACTAPGGPIGPRCSFVVFPGAGGPPAAGQGRPGVMPDAAPHPGPPASKRAVNRKVHAGRKKIASHPQQPVARVPAAFDGRCIP